MNCQNCGAEVGEQQTVCPNCGAQIQQFTEAASAAPSPVDNLTQQATTSAAPAEDESDFQILWQGRYALSDMNVIWVYTLLITVAFVALGIWMRSKGWTLGLKPGAFWGVMLAIPIVVWFIQFCRAIHRMTIRYRLTPHRLFVREGIVIRHEEAMELVGVEDIATRQTFIERFLCGGVGRVLIHSKDKTDPEMVLRGLRDYETAFRAIDQARRKERERRGIALI